MNETPRSSREDDMSFKASKLCLQGVGSDEALSSDLLVYTTEGGGGKFIQGLTP